MSVTGVSDEVWRRLDRKAVRLTWRVRVRVTVWAALAAVLLFVVLLFTASGLTFDRLAVGSVITAESGSGSCIEKVRVHNHGWFDEHVVGQSLVDNGSGATMLSPLARRIPSGGSRVVTIRLSKRFCDSLGHVSGRRLDGPAPSLVLRTHRPWGTSSVTVSLREPPLRDGGLTIEW